MTHTHEVYALRYSHREALAQEHFYRAEPCDSPMAMSYYTWLIRTPDGPVVVDTGYTRQAAEERGREYFGTPLETLRRLGVDPDEVRHVVLTHFHFDHTGHVDSFPRAQIVVQANEMRFWFGPDVHYGEYPALSSHRDLSAIVAANLEGRLRWVDGDVELAPGVSLHLVRGHTPGSQVVRIETAKGPVVLASDASHFYANIEQNKPYAIVHTVPLTFAAFERIRELAGPSQLVIPGHDPLVLERFPAPSPELQGVVARIA
jgi:glyoxylase-like metal-dependent hydrolase (beta-lactamase superfamily II)